jgi:predicted house-cleaning NTP pyrophosphatase (Maf/HAM1 superfamily)
MSSNQPFRLILGSSSPWRKRILSQMGYIFDVISPDIDEKGF